MGLLKGLLYVLLIPFAFVLFFVVYLFDFFCFVVGGVLYGYPLSSPLDCFASNFIDFWFSLLSGGSHK